MTKQVQRRRGTASQHTSFTGAEGEISVNTTNKSVHVHDGVTAGGVEAARADLANVSDASLNTALAGNTLSSLTITSADINGGTIDGTVIGGTTPAAVTATSLTATGTTTLAGASTTADITFGDNDKAIFGAGSDLQIYHSGSDSWIEDNGTGNLYIDTNGSGINISYNNSAENMATFTANGAATLYYDNAAKIATTSTGVDVTGTVTADGLTMASGSQAVIGVFGTSGLQLIGQTGSDNIVGTMGSSEPLIFRTASTERMRITSTGSVGIGTSSPSQGIHLKTASGNSYVKVERTTSSQGEVGFNTDNWYIYQKTGGSDLHFYNTADRMSITSTGNVGIGTTSPDRALDVRANPADDWQMRIGANNTDVDTYDIGRDVSDGLLHFYGNQSGYNGYVFGGVNGERMRIDASGNVGIGVVPNATGGGYKALQLGLMTNWAFPSTGSAYRSHNLYYDGTNRKYVTTGTAHEYEQSSAGHVFSTAASGTAGTTVTLSEAMRIDASGNLLVGKTSDSFSTQGQVFAAGGYTDLTRAGTVLNVNRLTSDGDIVKFYKDGTTVGSIGTGSGDLNINGPVGHSGIRFQASSILPRYNGADTDGTMDLGYHDGIDTHRWRDLYLSGGLRGDTLTFSSLAGSERMRIDSSGKVGIGTSSPWESLSLPFNAGLSFGSSAYPLTISRSAAGQLITTIADGYDSDSTRIDFVMRNGHAGQNTALSIAGSGNVGIGTTPSTANGSHLQFDSGYAVSKYGFLRNSYYDGSGYRAIYTGGATLIQGGDNFLFYTAPSVTAGSSQTFTERMRLDASGNLLVGDTSATFNDTAKTVIRPSSDNWTIKAGVAHAFNRTGSDGDILQFYRTASTKVGSIGTAGGDLYLTSTGGVAYYIYNGSISPGTDNARDLGTASFRWDDVYATNGTIQTSDANEKQDIDVLSDAEQRVAVAAKGLLRKFRWKDAVAEKSDDARIHFGIIAQDLQAAFAAEGLDAGKYAMFIHTTWTDEETGEERSRMGVRYSELLAFIIAAI